MRLGSAVTVLSSDDPIRVFQRFATLDAVSNGRAEVILGRGSFTESFPLFGLRSVAIRRAVRGKARSVRGAAPPGAGDLARRHAPAAGKPARVSAGRSRPAEDLDRGRRQPGIGRARGPIRPAADARDHRRRSKRVSALRRPLSPRLRAARQAGASRSACIRPATSPTPTSRRARNFGRITSGCATASAPNAAGRRCAAPSSTRRPTTGRCMSARRRQSPAGSPRLRRLLGIARFDMKYSAGALSHEKLHALHRTLRQQGDSAGA